MQNSIKHIIICSTYRYKERNGKLMNKHQDISTRREPEDE